MEEDRKRRRTRVPVHFEVTFQVRTEPIALKTENISLNGMLCQPDPRFAKGDAGAVRIVLGPDAAISAQAEIVRSDAAGLAIAFTEIDETGFFHLKKLVQYNTADADLIDRELRQAGF
ncbi:MAG: PilZ domain-containing protein [Deltaproteobacteria bacterium]|nr:PilZ domain-containing protein [Deltaproteobacteria bacterium]